MPSAGNRWPASRASPRSRSAQPRATIHAGVPGPPPARTSPARPSSAKAPSAIPDIPAGTSPRVRAGGGGARRGSVIGLRVAGACSAVSRYGGSASTIAKTSRPPSRRWTDSGVWPMTMGSWRRSATTPVIAATSWLAGTSRKNCASKCCRNSSSSGAVQAGSPASWNRAISHRSCASAWLSCWTWPQLSCLSAVQLGRPYSQAIAACASWSEGNSPAARRRFASSFRYRRLGRLGSRRGPTGHGSPSLTPPGPLTSGGKDWPSTTLRNR
jgi:hypothetical protein